MPSLYHALPDALVGSVFHPLNELESRAPEAWGRERAKYHGREEVLELRIPILDCLWNDVLHFGTVRPDEIVTALRSAGLEPWRRRFFEIDPGRLEADRTVIFLNRRAVASEPIDEADWLPFDPAALPELSRLTEPTIRYYRDCTSRGIRPRLYGYLPHVLYRGSLETRDLPIVEV